MKQKQELFKIKQKKIIVEQKPELLFYKGKEIGEIHENSDSTFYCDILPKMKSFYKIKLKDFPDRIAIEHETFDLIYKEINFNLIKKTENQFHIEFDLWSGSFDDTIYNGKLFVKEFNKIIKKNKKFSTVLDDKESYSDRSVVLSINYTMAITTDITLGEVAESLKKELITIYKETEFTISVLFQDVFFDTK